MQSKTGLTAAFIGLALMTTSAEVANRPITMRVSPAVSFAPANLVVRARLEPDVNNRAMQVIAESADFYRSSAIELEGERAPRTVTFEFRGLPPGQYEVTAAVLGTDARRRAVVRSRVDVMGAAAH